MSSHGEPDSDRDEKKLTGGTSSPASESMHTSAAPTEPSQGTNEDQEQPPKALAILEACRGGDIEVLTALAVSEGGFLSDDLRRHACERFPDVPFNLPKYIELMHVDRANPSRLFTVTPGPCPPQWNSSDYTRRIIWRKREGRCRR